MATAMEERLSGSTASSFMPSWKHFVLVDVESVVESVESVVMFEKMLLEVLTASLRRILNMLGVDSLLE